MDQSQKRKKDTMSSLSYARSEKIHKRQKYPQKRNEIDNISNKANMPFFKGRRGTENDSERGSDRS